MGSGAPVEDLRATLETIRGKRDVPALAAAVIFEGRIIAIGAAGVRKAGADIAVTLDDKFHIGSCTKAMTATLIAMLVEKGKLRWSTTIQDVFPEFAGAKARNIQPPYLKVTLKQLLSHRAGLEHSWPKDKSFLDIHNLAGSPRQQRYAFCKLMLAIPPLASPGTKSIYSNAGYGIAAAMAERATDTEWEKLMREMSFGPMGMKSAGFGAMGTVGRIDQPWQHRIVNGQAKPIPPGPLSDNPPAIGPGGTVHCSTGDWAKFIARHLTDGRDTGRLLGAASYRFLHTPPFGGQYALGWMGLPRPWGGRVLHHAGSKNANYCVVWMTQRRKWAVIVATNQGGDTAAGACDDVAAAMVRKYLMPSD